MVRLYVAPIVALDVVGYIVYVKIVYVIVGRFGYDEVSQLCVAGWMEGVFVLCSRLADDGLELVVLPLLFGSEVLE